MIELVLAFVAGLVYGIAGLGIATKLEGPVDMAFVSNGVQSRNWRVYADLMIVLLWPVLGVLMMFTAGSAALSGVGE